MFISKSQLHVVIIVIIIKYHTKITKEHNNNNNNNAVSQQMNFFIADLIACSTCFRHHYAHHQELESIIQVVAACRIWCLVFNLSVWCGAAAAAHKPDTQPSAPHHTDKLKTKHQI